MIDRNHLQAGNDAVFGSYLRFEPGLDKPKTKTWVVLNKEDSCPLGIIKWFSHWRKYCFFAADGTIFEENCLRGISNFVESKTKEHKT